MYFLIYLTFLQVFLCDSARILVFIPSPFYSHRTVFTPLINELASRGHYITVFSQTDLKQDKTIQSGHPNVTEINLFQQLKNNHVKLNTNHFNEKRSFLFEKIYKSIEEGIILSTVFQRLVKNSYDLVIMEPNELLLILSHVFKAPTILMTPLSQDIITYDTMAAPFQPILYQTYVHKKNFNLSYYEKISNLYDTFEERTVFAKLNEDFDLWLKKYTNIDAPSVKDLRKNVNALLWNTHLIWEDLLVPANVVSIWGIAKSPKVDLPEELKSFLDNSINGVIYVSLGTFIRTSSLPPNTIKIFVRVFTQLPYDILWKWEEDKLPSQAGNIKFCKWVPQRDVLGHPKIKLFINQGGIQSTNEAIDAGVPLIGIPIIGDQLYNTDKYVQHKIGLQLKLNNLHDDELRKSIHNVISDKSYYENVQKLGSLLRDQPQPPLQRAAWWVEHVLRHPDAARLRAPAADVSWMQYHQIDILIIILFILSTILVLLFYIIHILWFRFLLIITSKRLR